MIVLPIEEVRTLGQRLPFTPLIVITFGGFVSPWLVVERSWSLVSWLGVEGTEGRPGLVSGPPSLPSPFLLSSLTLIGLQPLEVLAGQHG